MSVLGVNYMQYQAGQAMTEAASNPSGGAATTGVGLGAGVGLGYAVGGQFAQGMMGSQQPTKTCINCGSIIPAANQFCPNCGVNQLKDKSHNSSRHNPSRLLKANRYSAHSVVRLCLQDRSSALTAGLPRLSKPRMKRPAQSAGRL